MATVVRNMLLTLALFGLSSVALAGDIVSINYAANSGNYYTVGVINYPTYPYYATVNGGSPQFMMTINDITNWQGRRIIPGDTWHATSMSVDEYGNYLNLIFGDPNGATKAHVLAYLFAMARGDNGDPSYVNAVAWFCNNGAPDIHGDPAAFALYDLVDDFDVSDFSHGEFSDVVVYVPLAEEPGLTFFGTTSTPEPSSLLLMGTGLVGVVGIIRRRLLS